MSSGGSEARLLRDFSSSVRWLIARMRSVNDSCSKIIGFSTHNPAQLRSALGLGCLDYVAYGPVFPTHSKERPDPVQGLEALRKAVRLTTLPLVAVGGITLDTIAPVLDAGADAAAVIGAIGKARDPHAATRALLDRARERL